MELASFSPAEAPSVEWEKAKIAGKGERPEKWRIGGARRKTGIPSAPRSSSSSRPGSACLLFTSAHFPARTKRRLKRGLCGGERVGFVCKPLRNLEVRNRQEFHSRPRVACPLNLFPHTEAKLTTRALFPLKMLNTISTQSSSAHVEERDQELWGTLEQDCLWLVSAKNNKSVSDWSIQVCTRAVERAACLACERVFPRNAIVDVNSTDRFLISAIPKQHLHFYSGRITGFSNFQIE